MNKAMKRLKKNRTLSAIPQKKSGLIKSDKIKKIAEVLQRKISSYDSRSQDKKKETKTQDIDYEQFEVINQKPVTKIVKRKSTKKSFNEEE